MSVRVRGPPSLWKMRTRPRPDTATLDRPRVLDPGLLRSVDMTRLSRDRLDHLVRERAASEEPRRMLNSTFRVRSHVRKGLREVFSSPTQLQQPLPSSEKEVAKTKSPQSKNTLIDKRGKKSVEDIFGTLIVSVPSPCSTCGRSERPERLHAHPSVPRSKRSKLREDQENNVVRSPVTKPVAMKFRSGKSRGDKFQDSSSDSRKTSPEDNDTPKVIPLIRKETFKIERDSKHSPVVVKKSPPAAPSPSPPRKAPPAPHPTTLTPAAPAPPPRRQALPRTPVKTPDPPPPPPAPLVHSGSPRRPRTITCYLCLKQFGTASYHLHEPQCLQKWHRENQALPVAQQLPEPTRPAGDSAWDNAWEVAQAAMVTCEGCSKTFLPHRLEAHLRVCSNPRPSPVASPKKSCKPQAQQRHHQQDKGWESDRSELSSSLLADGPPSVHCHICGRVYSREAVERHEYQCLRRWQQENSSRESSGSGAGSEAEASSPPMTPRRRLVLCYLCGRQFGTASIAIHEPQCLRKWRQENDLLPPAQRRPEPLRPQPVYDTDTGLVDYEATADVQWKSHLVQLVPCGKCGRTFNPDRVAVHQKCCKGPKH